MKKETALTALILAIVVVNSFSIITNNVFSEMQWTTFTYEFGFIKRGLIGELLRIAFGRPAREVVIALSYIVLAAALFAVSYFYVRPCAHATPGNRPFTWLFSILALSHFSTLQFMIHDTGRLDQVGFLCMALSLTAIERLKGMKTAAAVVVLSVTAVLIHEAYSLMFFPLVFCYWIFKDKKKTGKILAFILVASVAAYIGLYGNLKHTINRHDYINHLTATYGSWISIKPVWILYTTTPQHIRVTAMNFTLPVFYKVHALWLIALLPSIIIFRKMFRLLYATLSTEGGEKQHPVFIVALLLSPFSPLIMYFLGLDFGRWLSICVINVFVLLSLFLCSNRYFAETSSKMLHQNKKIIIIGVTAALLLGPVVKSQGFIWNSGYPPAALSCLNAARLYYGDYNASPREILDRIAAGTGGRR